MPRNVLQIYSSEFAARVDSLNDAAKRMVALELCEWAVSKTIPDDELVQTGLAALEKGDYGNQNLINSLGEHVNDLDKRHFDTRRTEEDFPLFAKARVASAVQSALSGDPFEAVTQSLYELCASLGTEEVEAEVDRIVGNSSQ